MQASNSANPSPSLLPKKHRQYVRTRGSPSVSGLAVAARTNRRSGNSETTLSGRSCCILFGAFKIPRVLIAGRDWSSQIFRHLAPRGEVTARFVASRHPVHHGYKRGALMSGVDVHFKTATECLLVRRYVSRGYRKSNFVPIWPALRPRPLSQPTPSSASHPGSRRTEGSAYSSPDSSTPTAAR